MKGRTYTSLLKFSPPFLLAATLAALACSSTPAGGNDGGTTAAPCIDTLCAAGNKCIDNGKGEIKCRLTCKEHFGAEGCRSNQYCKWSTTPSGQSYCADVEGTKVEAKPGQWGGTCNPTGGEDNEACDGAQGFKCFADSPTDVQSALCTTFGCKADSECPGQFYCATVNTSPSAASAERSIGQTRTVCLPRAHCSPCERDADCKGGRCVPDDNGVKSCMSTCDRDSACPKDAFCTGGQSDVNVCYPYAGVCKGDGDLCSPCRSDVDCKDGGVCFDALPNSTERFCTKKLDACTLAACGTPAATKNVGCLIQGTSAECKDRYPTDLGCANNTTGKPGYCTGFVSLLKDGLAPGCWSRKR